MNIKKHIPNFVTSLNAVSGFIAIIYAMQSDFMMAFYFIFLGAFFDFLDGGIARLLNVQSELGKQMDSLCDVITFGLAPGFILFSLMRNALGVTLPLDLTTLSIKDILLLLSTAIVPVFSVIRLAKFNIDTRQTESFIGLPVPANAILIASLGALFITSPLYWLRETLMNPYILAVISIVFSYMLVSPLPMFALKFKNLSWKDNKLRFIFIITSAVLLVSMGVLGLTLTILLYIIISLINNTINKK